jgi:citrate lyase subunit beta / citryl-CoA lyase
MTIPERPSALGRDPLQFVRRSTLMMPVNARRFVERAHQRGADCVLLDLEDSVAPAAKREARSLLPESVAMAGRGGADVTIRVNNTLDLLDGDIEATVLPGVRGIMLPKSESAEQVQAVDQRLAALEASRGLPVGSIEMVCQIETARGILNAVAVAAASPRIVAIVLGPEDYCLDIDVEPTPGGEEISYANQALVVAARCAGVQPLGLASTLTDYTDLEGFADNAWRGRRIGFKGALCIHPAQVAVLNEVFSPKTEEVDRARRIVELLDDAARRGLASASLDGKMIDTPVANRARRLVVRAAAIARREAAKKAALDSAQ